MTETVEILRLGHAGDGIAADGLFVPYTVPGDVVRIAREGPRGRLSEIVTPGPSRTVPPCAHFGRCGGCALQMVAREPYLAWKRDLVVTALKQRGLRRRARGRHSRSPTRHAAPRDVQGARNRQSRVARLLRARKPEPCRHYSNARCWRRNWPR